MDAAKRITSRPTMPAAGWRWVGLAVEPDPVSGVRQALPVDPDDTGTYPADMLDDLLAMAKIARK